MELTRSLAGLISLAAAAALGCAPRPAPEIAAPPSTLALEGGGRLLVLERPELTAIEGSVRFESGSIREPAQQAGLLEVLCAALYFGGPLQLTGAEFHERLLSRESTVLINPGPELVAFDFTCPPAALEETLDAIAQLIVSPGYPDEFVARARARAVDELELESEDPSALADRLLMDLTYGDDAPHTRRPTFATLESITREALVAWHAESFVRERMWIGVVGPVLAADVALRVAADFAELERGRPAPAVPQPPFRAPEESRVVELLLPHAERAELRFAAPGTGIAHADFAALRLWSDTVAGGGGSTGAFFAPRWGGGELFGYARQAPGRTNVLALLAHLDPQRFPAERLETARARLLASEDEQASPWRDLDRALELARHGLRADFWERHRAQLETLDASAVAAAAGRHLPQSGVLVVAVQPEGSPSNPLPTEHRSTRGELRGTPEAVALLARMLEALGGREPWADLNGLHLRGEVELGAVSQPVQVELWRDFLGRRLRLEQTRGETTTVQVLTPDGLWSLGLDDERATRLPDEIELRTRQREGRMLFRVLRELARGQALSVRLADERLVVLRAGRVHGWFTLGERGLPERWVVPRTEYEELFATDLEDWSETGGYVLPRTMTQLELGRRFGWGAVTPNPVLDEGLFR